MLEEVTYVYTGQRREHKANKGKKTKHAKMRRNKKRNTRKPIKKRENRGCNGEETRRNKNGEIRESRERTKRNKNGEIGDKGRLFLVMLGSYAP
jgi:hypothetical protein